MATDGTDWLGTMAALERGDAAAFSQLTQLVTGHLARLGAYEHRDSWQDLVQEVIVALLKAHRREAIREPRAFVSYVGTVTRNKFLDFVNARRRPGEPDPTGDPELSETAVEQAQSEALRRSPDLLMDLERGLAILPDKERQVVEALYLQGHSYKAAAELLGMPLGTVNRLQNQGLRKLREFIGVGKGDP